MNKKKNHDLQKIFFIPFFIKPKKSENIFFPTCRRRLPTTREPKNKNKKINKNISEHNKKKTKTQPTMQTYEYAHAGHF